MKLFSTSSNPEYSLALYPESGQTGVTLTYFEFRDAFEQYEQRIIKHVNDSIQYYRFVDHDIVSLQDRLGFTTRRIHEDICKIRADIDLEHTTMQLGLLEMKEKYDTILRKLANIEKLLNEKNI